MATIDGSTAELSRTSGLFGEDVRSSATAPALTILYHPDVRRVGERVVLSEIVLGREALVSRHDPEFSPPGQASGAPLSDHHISRQPIRFLPAAEGAVTLATAGSRTRVEADGALVLQTREIPAAALWSGVILELSGRIVLLLHLASRLLADASARFGLVGENDGLARVRGDVRRVADLDVPVLLRGETGTGKELIAQAIHDAGRRRNGPFAAVNLGAVPPTLVASELFGSVKGAFTGSVQSQEGWFRRAHGGTLFLDEVGEAPAEVQVMLLRALETGEIHPVGSQTTVRVDVRVVAATDANLEERVRREQFRAPLLHRLAGYEIWLPPLRERRDDIGRLLIHFLRQELDTIGEPHLLTPAPDAPTAGLWLPPKLVARLARYDWPGNVRQLRNVARQLVIGSRGLPRLEIGPSIERLLRDPGGPSPQVFPIPQPQPQPDRRKPSEVTGEELITALRTCRWDLQATAEALRISRTSLYALIEADPRIRKTGDLKTEEIVICHQECGGDLNAMVDRLEVSKKALGRRLREMGLL
jgi:two-component system, NtrC family, nitrogen regulation response regulator GlnG